MQRVSLRVYLAMPGSVSWAVLVTLSWFRTSIGPYLDHNHQGWAAPAHLLQRGSKGAGLREVLKKALPVLPGQGRDIWGMEHPRDPQPYGGGWEMAVGRASPLPTALCDPQEPGSSQGGPTLV